MRILLLDQKRFRGTHERVSQGNDGKHRDGEEDDGRRRSFQSRDRAAAVRVSRLVLKHGILQQKQ